jgi:hypothetical protein
MIISLAVIISLVYTMNNILEVMSGLIGNTISVESFLETLSNGTKEEVIAAIAILGSTIFMTFGFPVTIFLVSLNGLKK